MTRILDSPRFRSSKRCSAFLRHVIEHVADGRFDAVKERIIGLEVFEDADYDTNQDPVVRSTAGEVRKRLAQSRTADYRAHRQNPSHREWQVAVSAENRPITAAYVLAMRVFSASSTW